jgi:hypothetical protein
MLTFDVTGEKAFVRDEFIREPVVFLRIISHCVLETGLVGRESRNLPGDQEHVVEDRVCLI